jgi:hypothetical protein
MGDIYHKCSQVRIWLGCDDAECGLQQAPRRTDVMMDRPSVQQDPFRLVKYMAEDLYMHD